MRILSSIIFLSFFLFFLQCQQKESNKGQDFFPISLEENIEKINQHIAFPGIPSDTIDLIQFSGIEPDLEASHDFLSAIKRALDSLSARGGGTLHFRHPMGGGSWSKHQVSYRLDGPIKLPSHVRLLIDPSVRLYFPFQPDRYFEEGPVARRFEGTSFYGIPPLINAMGQSDIAIQRAPGLGADPIIDGDGARWVAWEIAGNREREKQGLESSTEAIRTLNDQDLPLSERILMNGEQDFFRPTTLQFFLSTRCHVEGIQFQNPPFWVVHTVFSEEIRFKNLTFQAPNINNDGIDVESSRWIWMEGLQFNNLDDNVVLKAGRDREGREGVQIQGTGWEDFQSPYINSAGRLGGPTEEVVLINSVLKGHNGIAMGSEMSGGIRNFYAINNRSIQPLRHALYIKSNRKRGGTIENIYVKGLYCQKVTSLVQMRQDYYGDADEEHFPIFRSIYIQDIHAEEAERGIRLQAWPTEPIKALYFDQVSIQKINSDPPRSIEKEGVEEVDFSQVFIEGKKWTDD